MYVVTATGLRADIEAAGEALSWMDPSPCLAVDMKEDSRVAWRLDAYAQTQGDAYGCAGVIEYVAPTLNARTAPVENQDWVAKSLEGLPPVIAGPFVVAGSHALAQASPGKTAVLIEAGPAFGTGHHGTTLGCLLAFDEIRRKRAPGRTLDLGTGSGVLAIAALKAAATSAVGTDIDADSVRVAEENAEKNNVAARFRAFKASGVRSPAVLAGAPYQTVFANILAKPLIRLAPDIARVVAPGGDVILSGLLTAQEPSVRAAFASRGLILQRRIRRDGWLTLVFRKPKRRPAPERARRASPARTAPRRRTDARAAA
ncbi:MAG: 50S ribosomal protein L11 methyltransferase [Pseudomonadota bacterium]